jgi:alkanesulfonate monooxygenase SsuD/methylene tetrahydromethanopterin reductase-like flavin-dependent oxidoreductase (luciferase family)
METYVPWVVRAPMEMERVRLGAISTPPARRPSKLACETATLDHLSRGASGVASGLRGTA